MKNVIVLLLIVLSNSSLFADWELTGPGQASVSCVNIEGDELYVGAGGRINLSTNKGDSWLSMNGYGTHRFDYIYDIITKDSKVFVGTMKGLYTTIDKGENWKLDSIDGQVSVIWDLKKKGNDIFCLSSSGRLFLSNDNGKIWNLISPLDWFSGRVISIDGSSIYVGGLGIKDKPTFWISHDYGKTWISINDTLSGLITEEIISIAASGDYVYVGVKENGLFISSNRGDTWHRSESVNISWSPIYKLLCKGDTVLAGNDVGILFSTDRGQNWVPMNFNFPTKDISVCGQEIYLASEGVAVSTDNGENWVLKQRGLGSANILEIVQYNNAIYAGSSKQGVFVSYDECQNWERFNEVSEYASISNLAFLDSSIFMSRVYTGKFQYSNDFGKTWIDVDNSNGIPNVNIKCLAIDQYKKNIFAGNGTGLYISNDLGKSWNVVNEDVQYLNVREILINDEEIYVGDHQFGVYISTAYGVSWKQSFTQNNLPENVHFIALTLCEDNIIVGTSTTSEIRGLYISNDMGESWISVSDSSSMRNIIDLITFENYVFAGTDNGILLSTNCGENWIRPVNYLNAMQISKLLIQGNSIYAATPEGVFKANLSDFGITDVKDSEIEKPNYLYCYPPYPMPATNIVRSLIYWDTSIDFKNEDITVYDIYGMKVSGKDKIILDKQTAYSGVLTWDCTNVPDGIYLLRIIHGTKVKTLKVIVNR